MPVRNVLITQCVQVMLRVRLMLATRSTVVLPVTSQKTQRQTEATADTIVKPQGRCEYSVPN